MLLIYKMTKGKQSQNQHAIQLTEAQMPSPHSAIHSEGLPEQISHPLYTPRAWKFYSKTSPFLTFLFFFSLFFTYEVNALRLSHDQIINDPTNFQFMVFCPVSSADFLPLQGTSNIDKKKLSVGGGFKLAFKKGEQYLPGNTYVVRVESRQVENKVTLYYCGKIRYFNDTCDNSFDSCSSSPMFDLEQKGSVDIIWINNINSAINITNTGTCLDSNYSGPFKGYCTLEGKANMSQTYNDPTDMTPQAENDLKISFSGWPISTHVHGGEVRPTFDGNPLSWNSNDPNKKSFGIAAFSLNERCYYDSFESTVGNKKRSFPPSYRLYDADNNIRTNFKVNRYPNQQNPGTLWYHDHAMHLTQYNVKVGLAGFYILRDLKATQYLGIARQNEKFVLITNNQSRFELSGLTTQTVYRFRFLNGNYASGMTFRYSFSYNDCDNINPDLETFTVIGADSSLFAYGIENQQHFVLSNAERVDLLIKFAPGRGAFSICADANYSVPPPLRTKLQTLVTPITGPNSKFNIKGVPLARYSRSKDVNNRTSIRNINLSKWVAYTNLSLVPKAQIRVSRFRPLIIVNTSLTIHGRVQFHAGKSENPVMGTIEDWYIINTMSFAHPIHIHLINFQIINVFTLKQFKSTTSTCPYYQLDFMAQAVKNSTATDLQASTFFPNGTVNYTYLCDSIRTVITDNRIIKSIAEIYPEDQVKNRKSGLDLFVKEDNNYKYIQGPGHPSPKVEYNQWKDTAFIDKFEVLQFRVRWSKSNYTAAVDNPIGSYFHAPADTLREYPGYVYHCHILDHEDNEMMRPIMLQLPQDGPPLTGPCPQRNWVDKVPCINRRCALAAKNSS